MRAKCSQGDEVSIGGGPAPPQGSSAQGQALLLEAQKHQERELPRLGECRPEAGRTESQMVADQWHVTVMVGGAGFNGLTEMLVKPSPVT